MAHTASVSNPILDAARDEDKKSQKVQVATDDKLALAQEAIAESTASTVAAIEQARAGVKQTAVATDVIQTATADITSANQLSQQVADIANLKAQNATISAIKSAGAVEQQEKLLSTMIEDGEDLEVLLKQKSDIVDDEFTGIGLIDNIINGFRSSQLNVQIDAAQDELSASTRQIQNVAAASESVARVNALAKETTNKAVIESRYKAIAAEGRKQSAEQEIKNVHSNARAISFLQGATKSQLDAKLTAARLQGEQESRAIRQEVHAQRVKEFAVQAEKNEIILPQLRDQAALTKLQLEQVTATQPSKIPATVAQLEQITKDLATQEAFRADQVELIQVAQSAAGGEDAVEPVDTIISKLSATSTKARYLQMAEIGMNRNAIIADNAFDAKSNLSIISPDGNIPATPGVILLDIITQKTIEEANKLAPGSRPKTEEQIKAAFNKMADETMAAFASNVTEGNPYVAPPMSVLEGFTSIKSTALYKNVLAAQAMKETDPQRIVDAALAGVRAKSITPEQAAEGIATIFTAAADYNNSMFGGFERVGLPQQVSYITNVRLPTSLFERLKADPLNVPRELITTATAAGLETFGLLPEPVSAAVSTRLTLVNLMDETIVQNFIVNSLSIQEPITNDNSDDTGDQE